MAEALPDGSEPSGRCLVEITDAEAAMPVQKPVKHAVIACHPASRSITMSAAARYAETARSLGHEVVIRDLYRLGFDPVLKDSERPAAYRHAVATDVAAELAVLQATNVFVLLYPIWFGTPPAMLKGYIERVLGSDFSFEAVRSRKTNPLLSGKLLVSFSFSGTSRAWLDDQGVLLSLRTIFDDYLCRAFSLADAPHFHFDRIPEGMAPNFGEEIMTEVEERTREICARFGYDPAAHRGTEI